MTVKPTYEDLERRVQELEKIESEHKYCKEALRENENLFKMLYEKAPLGYQSLDENGHFIVVNQTWLDTLGYEREEVIGKSFADFLHHDWRDHFKENFPRFKSIGEVLVIEFEMVKKNGDLILVSFTGKISRDKTGDFQQTHCIFHDITKRKRSEEALKKSEWFFRSTLDGLSAHITVLDDRGEIIFTNKAYRDFGERNGIDPRAVSEGVNYLAVCDTVSGEHSEEAIPFAKGIREVLSGKRRSFELEYPCHSPGEKRWFIGHVTPFIGEGPRWVVVAHENITKRMQAEEALRENEKILRQVIDLVPHFIFAKDVEGTFLLANKAVADAYGTTPENLLGKSDYDFSQNAEEVDFFVECDRKVIKSGTGIYGIEEPITDVKRTRRYLETTKIPFTAFGTKIPAMLGISVDITERKQAETEREKLQAQLNQAQKMESVGRLAGGVAHDFNNMLGVILGHTELALLQADENHDLYSDLKEIQTAATRSADITKQLLAFARKQTISPRKLDLNDTVESMLNMLRRLIGEDIDLVWQPAAHIWPVKMDPSQIDQILANLCINARDAISDVGKLIIETGRKSFDEEYCGQHSGFIPGDFVLLAVSDNGCGIDKDTLKNLFEPFFTTKEVGKGTGLGLATVYGIVKQNNGFINVYSEPGQGSTFKIYLPRLVADVDTDKAVPEKKAAAGGTETILLVEDEPAILRMTHMMLEQKGYTVLSAATPSEAVEKAKNHSGAIDLLMTDVVMPEMNGRDLAGQIYGLYPGIRLLFMSGYTANVIVHQGVLDDGVAFIQKPFSMADMTEKVREVLDIAADKNQG